MALRDAAGRVQIAWSVVLRDGSNYVRETVTISAIGEDVPIAEVRMVDAGVSGAHVVGSVRGSPIVVGGLFLGMEDPLSNSKVASK